MKKTLLLTSTLLLAVAPIATVVSCSEPDPAMQTWVALSDGVLNVTMEAEYPPYNFAIDRATYDKIEKQANQQADIPNDGLSPQEAKDYFNMILPIDPNSPAYDATTPYIGGIDPYMARSLADKMSTPGKKITVAPIYVQTWDKIKQGWSYDPTARDEDGNLLWPKDDSDKYDMVISAMAPDDDKKPKHLFTNEYLLTENVIAQRYDKLRLDAKTIANWQTMHSTEKAKYGKIAIEDFPASDPEGKNNIAVKYFGIDYVEQKGDLDDVYEAITNVENTYAFIEDIQAEELRLRSGGSFAYTTGLFPKEPPVKSSMSVRPGTQQFVLNHINSYLKDVANPVEQDWMKFTSIKMSAYCNPKA